MVTLADAALKAADRLRAQPGPRARHGLARPRPPRLQLPALGHRLRARDRAARAARSRCSPRARASPACTARRWREIEGLELPCADRDGERRGWFVFVVQLPRGVDRDETVRALAAAGVQSKPYLPAIHLMSFYRERFGHREGEFPVCEDVAARSLALPFFPEMTEGQVARVAEALRRGAGGAAGRRRLSARVALPRAPGPDFQRLNSSIELRPAAVAAGRRAVARAREDARRARDHRAGGPRRAARRARRRWRAS